MTPAPVLLVTGPPGSGKSTVAWLVADRFEQAVCLESDWFWTTIVRGHVLPWLAEADVQNRTVLRACAAAAAVMAVGGYTVVVDGIVVPGHIALFADELGRVGADTHYVVLRPSLEVALERAMSRVDDERVPGHPALVAEEPIRHIWQQFSALGPYERHVVDTSALGPDDTAALVWTRFVQGTDRL